MPRADASVAVSGTSHRNVAFTGAEDLPTGGAGWLP
jgi:hypothetical protein